MNNNKKRLEMVEKYREAVLSIARAEDVDMFVAFSMLVYMNNVKQGRQQENDVYGGLPANFDFKAFEEDYRELIQE